MKQAELLRLLPALYQEAARPGSPLSALVAVMEEMHAPSEEVLARLDDYVSPYRAPERFLPLLARWVRLDHLLGPDGTLPSGSGRLRELVARAALLARWRGTTRGLIEFLELATGARGFAVDERVAGPDGEPLPFHFKVRAPRATEVHRGMLERIVDSEKPAYVTYELTFE